MKLNEQGLRPMINRPQFYRNFKATIAPKFTTKQYEGFEAIFNEFEAQKLTDIRWLVYILATVWHETDKTMQPIEEYGKGKGRRYGKKLRYNGKSYTTPDKLFYGRGHTQNTWIDIYEKLTNAGYSQGKTWNFVKLPELLLQMQPSIWATFHAMQTGLYTGKRLSQYFGISADPYNARKIINGVDKADLIKQHYDKFLRCLS